MTIRLWGWPALALLGACAGWTAETGHSPSGLEQARAYERGAGVARDYHAAAEIYRTACDDGRGDLAACRSLVRAYVHTRGVDGHTPEGRALATRVCRAHHDPYLCMVAASPGDPEVPADVRAEASAVVEHRDACDVAHPSECEARLWRLSTGANHTSHRARREVAAQACHAGVLDGCVELEHARHVEPRNLAEATRALQIACDARDADACAAAPDRTPIALAALCTASDYQACARLGCQGDAAAKQRAASHGVVVADCRAFDPPGDDASDVVAKMTEFNDKMCACSDKPCADGVVAEMTAWGQEQAKNAADGDPPEPPDKEIVRQIAAVTESMTKCMIKAMMAGQPTP